MVEMKEAWKSADLLVFMLFFIAQQGVVMIAIRKVTTMKIPFLPGAK